MSYPRLALGFVACMAAGPVLGHEFWIEPVDYTLDPGAPVIAELKNGQEFVGNTLSYFGPRITRFDMIRGNDVVAVMGRVDSAT